jgi:hypothetical protein
LRGTVIFFILAGIANRDDMVDLKLAMAKDKVYRPIANEAFNSLPSMEFLLKLSPILFA